MLWNRSSRSALIAAAIAGAVAAGPFLTEPAEAGPNASRDHFTRPTDNDRPVHDRRGPFFGLRVNSMDVDAKADVTNCFSYRCPGLGKDSPAETYQLVRSVHVDASIDTTPCDEILRRPFLQRQVRFRSTSRTTRWIRDLGPNGRTPVGGFVGAMRIDAVLANASGDGVHRIPFMDFRMIGTQGLRPHRGDPADSPDPDSRCDAPYHDEGYYHGGLNVRGLRQLLKELGADDDAVHVLRRLQRNIIAGTFEGTVKLADDAQAFDFCEIDRVQWWFDGLLGYACRQPRDAPANDHEPTTRTDVLDTPDEAL